MEDPSRETPLSRFAAEICDFLSGTPGGEVREEVRAMGAMATGMGVERMGGWERRGYMDKIWVEKVISNGADHSELLCYHAISKNIT